MEDPWQATAEGHALPHSQCASVAWQGAQSSCSTGHGSCCSMPCCSQGSWHCLSSSLPTWNDDIPAGPHWTKCSGTSTDLVPELGTENRSPGSHCSLMRFLLQSRRWLAKMVQKDVMLMRSPLTMQSLVTDLWTDLEGTVLSTASSITMIGDNKTYFDAAQAEDHSWSQKRWRGNTVASNREIAMFLLSNLILPKKGLTAHRELFSPLSSTGIIISQLLWPQSTPVLLNSFYQPPQILPFIYHFCKYGLETQKLRLKFYLIVGYCTHLYF